MRHRLLSAYLLFGACDGFSDRPIILDSSSNCRDIVIETLMPELEGNGRPWQRVIAAASDGPTPVGAWLLVEDSDKDGTIIRGLRHLDGAGVNDRDVQLPYIAGEGYVDQLLTGPAVGEAWLVRQAPGSTRLFAVDMASPGPEPRRSADLGGFPDVCGQSEATVPADCDVRGWRRDLVFIGAVPYLMAVPPNSENATITFWLTRVLRNDSVLYLSSDAIQLRFSPRCSAEGESDCGDAFVPQAFPQLEVAAIDHNPRSGTVAVTLVRDVVYGIESPTGALGPAGSGRDFAVILLGINQLGSVGGAMWSDYNLQWSLADIPDFDIVSDRFALYVAYTDEIQQRHVVRTDSRGSGFTELFTAEQDGSTHQLLQMQDDFAIGHADGRTWEILKLLPDAMADSRQYNEIRAQPIAEIQSAGPGGFLLRYDTHGPDLVGLRCGEALAPD